MGWAYTLESTRISPQVTYLKQATVIQNQRGSVDHEPLHAAYGLVNLGDFASDQDRVVYRSAQPDAGLDYHTTDLAKYLSASTLHGIIAEHRLLFVMADHIPVGTRYGVPIELGGVDEII